MKNGYAAAFLFTVLVLCYGIVKSGKSERKIAAAVRRLLIVAVLAVLSNLVVMLSELEMVSMIAYSCFFVCIDWLLYDVLLFAIEYTGYQTRGKVGRNILYLLLGIDTASMMLNILFHHAFTCRQVVTETGELYYRIDSYLFYHLHLILSYLLVLTTVLFLLGRIRQAPVLYRGKYILVFGVLAMTVIGDAVYVFMGQVIDVSILFFAVAGMIFYYFSIVYEPKDLVNSTLSLVVQGMTEAVLLFDAEGTCIHVNESAKRLLGVEMGDTKDVEQMYVQWNAKQHLGDKLEYSWDQDLLLDGREYHLKFGYHRMLDKKGRYLGSFFVVHDHTEEINHLKKEHYRATHDRLTGLYNKEYFYERAAAHIRQHQGEQFLMLCSNVRNFKFINDVFGLQMGDELLIKIADALRNHILPGEVYGRLESDRFAVLMKREDYRADMFAQGSQQMVRFSGDISYPVNIHIGIYEINHPDLPVSVMCDRAFMALGTIKENYQRRVAYYDDALRESVLLEQELAADLETAIETGQFRIYLQPQITAEGEVRGAEALVRWMHPKKGLLMPGTFIEGLEKNGMIIKLDQHVWELACRQLRKWKEQGRGDLYLSVNISTRDFYFLDVYRVFTELVQKYEIDPGNLKLEITETAVMMDLERQLELIEKLRTVGFVVEMDDFGSGYSSLNMLKNISVDVLKIDMEFLGKTRDEERGRKILKMVIELSKELGMPVITEGVETEEQVAYLTEIGCDMFQGFYFARPMQITEFEGRYMKQEMKKSVLSFGD